MATMPSRSRSLKTALPSVLAQVDKLSLYLDGFVTAPPIARHAKITILRSADFPALGCSGKFLGLALDPVDCIFMGFDDDIIYPPDYADELVRGLMRHNGNAIVGFHGVHFNSPFESYVRDRSVIRFQDGLQRDQVVDEIGSGTMAFLSRTIGIDPRNWSERGMDDLLVAIEAERRGVPRIAIRRQNEFLRPIEENQGDSVWMKTRRDDSGPTARLQTLVAIFPARRRTPTAVPVWRHTARKAQRRVVRVGQALKRLRELK